MASSSDSDDGTPRGTNYFFGFLIAFAGLVIIFIACGIGSRRRFTRRRERRLNGLEFSNGKLEGEETPQLHEHWFVVGEDRWSNLMPLSVTLFKENESDSVAHDLRAVPPPARSSTGRFFPWFNNNSSLHTQTDLEPPDTIQVAVAIIMPCRDMSLKTPDVLPEYQIGEISLPWIQDPHQNP